jgi:hypothetical protein
MKSLIAVLFIGSLTIGLLSGCGTMTAATQATVATDAGTGIGLAIDVAEASVLAPVAAPLNAALTTLCAMGGQATPQAAETALETGISGLENVIQSAGPSVGGLISLINAGVTSAEANAETSGSDTALTDLTAFVDGLCAVVAAKGHVDMRYASPKMGVPSFGSALKWDAHSLFVRSFVKKNGEFKKAVVNK